MQSARTSIALFAEVDASLMNDKIVVRHFMAR